MSSAIKPGLQTKTGGLAGAAPTTHAIFLDKLNRHATPDSEVLASSDDEGESHRQEPLPPPAQPQRPVRRASWFNDNAQTAVRQRKDSFASTSMSPTTSHPSAPSAESGVGAWGSHPTPTAVLSRAHTASGSFPWGVQIWTNERKELPARLAEVMLPSPTSALPPGPTGHALFGGDGVPSQTSPAPRDQGPNSHIPFAIPLHPTPKTYRSQSYSVGQLEPDASAQAMMGPPNTMGGRGRPMAHSGLQHRPSRPSMLSEMSNEGGMLGKVKEVDDDDDESTNGSLQSGPLQSGSLQSGSLQSGSLQSGPHQSAEAMQIELLTRENAMLRQQQQHVSHQYKFNNRPRASTGAVFGMGNGYGVHESVPEESDYAVDELDETHDNGELAGKRGFTARRMSEYGGAGSGSAFRSHFTVENRKLENVKKAYWQSSLGFGGTGDVSQSRRHSFAEVPMPTRQASIGSIGEAVLTQEPGSLDPHSQHSQDLGSPYGDTHNLPPTHAQSYFAGGANLGATQSSMMGNPYGNAYQVPYHMHATFSNRPSSPHRGMYGMTQPNRSTPLHVVLFKCSRADVFYIQEGTGLTVKPGDLVIVEADRGTDLGTVAANNVDWVEAKRQKEHYAEEQYKWLMMYSQNAGVAQEGVGAGLMAASNPLQGSAVGGMGPPGQHHMQEPNAGELKPKLIKRLAQNHEIHALRDKEGNEAKAKRVCMQKVKEHGLNMEILDAEFQMDWKKLTFYYFADSYINFNSLVTDLFKIYKTRIWMSAINPASFASQPLGLQAPSGIGPGAVGVGRGGSSNAERRPNQPQEPAPSTFTTSTQPPRPFSGGSSQPFGGDRGAAAGAQYPPTFSYGPYAAFGNVVPRAPGAQFSPGLVQGADSYSSGFPQGSDYQGLRGRLPVPQTGSAPHEQSISPLAGQGDWVGVFQGLSLNTR